MILFRVLLVAIAAIAAHMAVSKSSSPSQTMAAAGGAAFCLLAAVVI